MTIQFLKNEKLFNPVQPVQKKQKNQIWFQGILGVNCIYASQFTM
jgi:hypothetical protein